MSKFTFIDLFAGIGGFRLGLVSNGGKCVGFSEIDRDAISTYCENYDEEESENLGDIRKLKEIPDCDILTAGVPCQSWSIAGKNLGFDDDRGQLWNDTIYLLNKNRPKAFIFENVKGLRDPRNREAFKYILDRIKKAGYFANYYLINSHDYGVPQNRQRVYIIGFREESYYDKFNIPPKIQEGKKLYHYLSDLPNETIKKEKIDPETLFGEYKPVARTKFQKMDELNDFFLFNDIRNGHSTIHSWDLQETTEREKQICHLLLTNRRKKIYGSFDGNALSFDHFKSLDSEITNDELKELVKKEILKEVDYTFRVIDLNGYLLSASEELILEHAVDDILNLEKLKNSHELKKKKVNYRRGLDSLLKKSIISSIEKRYDFKNSKISSGIKGINRIYLPISDVFSTLVASDTNDFIATRNIVSNTPEDFKDKFLKEIVEKSNYRKISKEEALMIQGFPKEFKLPIKRNRWMKLIGNSVSVPVIEKLCQAILETGLFNE
ncbi:DNA (cytosine-5-)-methyltransferase [Marinifilum flexuosum]|uniref:Cytosine-specific methyltransferase n=1 Tax=Marinifilum flexuosum TaxID=1117708 RepID=A0A419X715_9BACT|nr:DNA (cytosine-5-)-methyltransferase [Marinifilum flexuosum]RKE03485.1 DNA (cytosine-5)-methyltransferase 1 [Marinifilum flexuosum]